MVTRENVDLILSGGAVGRTLVDADGIRHTVVGFGHMSVDLSVLGSSRRSYNIVTSGPKVDFYCHGVKHKALSSPEARLENKPRPPM